MNQEKRPYVLKPGCSHWIRNEQGELEVAIGGTIVELTDSGFEMLSDRFDPVDVVTARADHAAELAAAAVEAAGEPAEPPVEASEYKYMDLIKMIQKCNDADRVKQIGDSEADGKNRQSVFNAARKRLDELTA